MNLKLFLCFSLSILIIPALSSCFSDGDDFNSKVGKIVTVQGEIVKGPSGYMLYRGVELSSIYLLPDPDGKNPRETEKKIADFAYKNVARTIVVTGKLYFHESNLPNKMPEESVVLPDDFYYIIWDAEDTTINAELIL